MMGRIPAVSSNDAGVRFHATVSALHDALQLDPAEPEDLQEPAYITIDDFDIELDSTPDETSFRCSVTAGWLSTDKRIWPEQLLRILKQNLAIVSVYRICVLLEGAEEENSVVLQFALPYSGLDIAELMEQLNELVHLAENYRSMLDVPTDSISERMQQADAPIQLDTIIFRP
jgi:hypothetical protein